MCGCVRDFPYYYSWKFMEFHFFFYFRTTHTHTHKNESKWEFDLNIWSGETDSNKLNRFIHNANRIEWWEKSEYPFKCKQRAFTESISQMLIRKVI